MERLTAKGLINDVKTDNIPYLERYKKLSQLEDVEEEIGIDLITLFKALKNGVYYFENQGQLIHDYVWLINNYVSAGVPDKISFSFMTFSERLILLFKDYGKTWFLTKKDSTKEEFDLLKEVLL